MKQLISHVMKFRALFVLLGVVCLLLVAGAISVEGAPSLIYWSPDPVQEGDEVTFSALATYDSYKWWKSDGPGNYCTVTDSPASTEATYTYSFYETGNWEVCFEGTVGTGESAVVSTDSQTVAVTNLPPVIESTGNWTVTPEPSVAGVAYHVEVPFTDFEDTGYTCTINYGDETGELAGTITHIENVWKCVGPDHTYTTAGQFDVHATVTDILNSSSDSSDYYYHTVTAAEHLFTWDTTELLEGNYTTFTAVAGYTNHYWTRGSQPGDTCNMAVSYSYISPIDIWFDTSGEYQVCLAMFDATNKEVFDSQWVTVTNVAPNNIEIYTYPQTAFPLMEVNVYGYFRDYYDGPYTIVVDWGDSSTPETFDINDTRIPDRPHTYAAVGAYTIQVSITDKDGATGTGSATQYVNTVMVEEDVMWMASDTLPTTIELQGITIGAQSLTVAIATPPAYGTLGTPTNAVCQPVDMPNAPMEDLVWCKATVVYNPDGTYSNGYDSFTFTMSDSTNTSPAGMINLWVGPNGAPIALDSDGVVSMVSPSYVVLTATDPDIYNYYNDRITFTIDNQPENGTLGTPGGIYCQDSMNPITEDYERKCTISVLYTPNPGTTATADSFTFHVNDTHQDSNTAAVSLTLRAPVTLHVNTAIIYDDGICDESSCGLREAVDTALVGDNIDFTLPLPAIIYLGGEQHITISNSITITGPGAHLLAISGAESSRVFEFNNFGLPMIASVSGLTIKDGRADQGGGILIEDAAEVTVNDCVIGPNNIVTYAGGGIANMGGMLTLNRSTVVENHGTGTLGGAGIVTAWSESTSTLINSTVTGNVTNNYGGGILAAYGGVVHLIHSTVTGNLANENYLVEPWGGGGGIAIIDDGAVSIQNSIVAGNTDLTGLVDPADEDYHPAWTDVSGTYTSLGGNLVGDGTGSTGWIVSDLVGNSGTPINPILNALTLDVPDESEIPNVLGWDSLINIYALLEGSPAIDAAPSCAAATDQRGVTRPQGEFCDIGAFEFEFPSIPTGVNATDGTEIDKVQVSWNPSSGTTYYEVYRNTSNTTSLSTLIGSPSVASYADTSATSGVLYWYFIKACNIGGCSGFSASDSGYRAIPVPLPGAFSKTSPTNLATNRPANLTLKWGTSTNVVKYEYCIDKTNDNKCGTGWKLAGTSTSASLTGLTPAKYYWQVRARNGAGITPANGGAWWAFTVPAKPGAFSKISPLNNATGQLTNLTLKWGASTNAAKYEYCIDTTAGTTCTTSWKSTNLNKFVNLTGLLKGKKYYWMVRAVNATGTTLANGGTWWNFTIKP